MPSRLQLAELEQLIAASDALSFMAESAGARPVHTLRNAIQLQCKTFLEDMHTHSLTQLTGRALRDCATCHAHFSDLDACSVHASELGRQQPSTHHSHKASCKLAAGYSHLSRTVSLLCRPP